MANHLPAATTRASTSRFPSPISRRRGASTASSSAAPRGAAATTGSTSISSAIRSSRTRSTAAAMSDATSLVDGQQVPVRHFGVVTDRATWDALAARFRAAKLAFVIEPYVRFARRAGRAGDDVLPRPVRQRARIQGVRRHEPAVRDVLSAAARRPSQDTEACASSSASSWMTRRSQRSRRASTSATTGNSSTARTTLRSTSPIADALIVRNRTQVDAALLSSAPRLRVIGRLGVGLDNIDIERLRGARHRRHSGHRRQCAGGRRIRHRRRDAAAARRRVSPRARSPTGAGRAPRCRTGANSRARPSASSASAASAA